jgi:hypothetical protein
MDAMEFFRRSSGNWKSQRTTHHLPFRRSETGQSKIQVETLPVDHPMVPEICALHNVDPTGAIGGAHVSWDGSMSWDKQDENHQGSTVFVLVPEPGNPQKGILLRERGYAEIVPVAGNYYIDGEDALVLVTEYETMSIFERFWFVDPNTRMITSTVQRFGGFSTATFCVESKIDPQADSQSSADSTSFYALSGW